ncbi:hypothetical protein HMPREF0495_01769 [Levilactobacillus brevis ATCC 14869 = DSM 20054]|uniref:Uncharacterized protein n=1 Tax=Levilactobacillus brevis ATCC 14869 = DSM 20054 TaxID=649758 RepID=U2QNE7_LEVBR|nr:hypothetical protein HMPREF0495_01769 [Levilactobacillus brevis ATCC 14869 = DSM 20054]KIO97024.1 hypothetical protein N627_1996 [Levilactobacillus brevis]
MRIGYHVKELRGSRTTENNQNSGWLGQLFKKSGKLLKGEVTFAHDS